MILTFDTLPADLIEALRKMAEHEGRSVQEVALQAMARGSGMNTNKRAKVKLDLSDILGTWVDDVEFDEAMKDFDRIEVKR